MEASDVAARNKLLSDVYLDATNTIRHYDTQRASFASLSVAGLAILFTFVAVQAKDTHDYVAIRFLSVFIVALSLIGLLLTLKIDALIRRHRARARIASNLLAESGNDAVAMIDEQLATRRRPAIDTIRIGTLWVAFFALFAIAGVTNFILMGFVGPH